MADTAAFEPGRPVMLSVIPDGADSTTMVYQVKSAVHGNPAAQWSLGRFYDRMDAFRYFDEHEHVKHEVR